jgi:hypothetical protein
MVMMMTMMMMLRVIERDRENKRNDELKTSKRRKGIETAPKVLHLKKQLKTIMKAYLFG